ncbi:hypothetical protein WICPIJ_001009 [Wickerhamomyces pijperi]|uniref:Uncharacterized protein n=1 Tax=Wickerhamomyces pijperi TaxID=599730 RepID=A0A9P8QEQ4_WICPI|nr:hypothetical protein WICPIJ_001009 [Wickerhamomyces pijperi]
MDSCVVQWGQQFHGLFSGSHGGRLVLWDSQERGTVQEDDRPNTDAWVGDQSLAREQRMLLNSLQQTSRLSLTQTGHVRQHGGQIGVGDTLVDVDTNHIDNIDKRRDNGVTLRVSSQGNDVSGQDGLIREFLFSTLGMLVSGGDFIVDIDHFQRNTRSSFIKNAVFVTWVNHDIVSFKQFCNDTVELIGLSVKPVDDHNIWSGFSDDF